MREIAKQTIRCFARGCLVDLFTDFGVPMDAILKNIVAGNWHGPSPADQPRFWYASDVNRCYCLDHGRQYAMLAKDLPLALQELSALAQLYPDYRTKLSELDPAYQNVRRAEDRVAHLRQVEAVLVPLAEEEKETSLGTHAGLGCTRCSNVLHGYQGEFRALTNRVTLSSELTSTIRSQLCDVGQTAFDRLLSKQQDPASPRQS